MRHQFSSKFFFFSIGIFLAMTLAASWCAAQYAPNNGIGNTPMEPASPSSFYRQPVPTPPTQPPAEIRPSPWPRDASPAPPQSLQGEMPPANQLNVCEGSTILAHVGSEVILESDVDGPVNDFLSANKDKIPASQLEATRVFLIRKQLKNVIQAKLIFLDAKQTIPSEHWPDIEKQMQKMFEESELDKMMKRTGAASRSELDRKLRALGSSVEQQKRTYFERELARQWLGQQVKVGKELGPDEMLAYYRDHIDEFTTPARVKWEELMTRTAKYPSEEAAFAALARMGNQVVIAGANFADVAKASSDGPTAPSGGAWDWTTKGALACQDIDKAIFSLPVGQMSPIIKEPNGFHIVRVTCREAVKVTPFLEAQRQIRERREKIAKERSDKQIREYTAKLEARTPVTTIFDGQKDSTPELFNRHEAQQ